MFLNLFWKLFVIKISWLWESALITLFYDHHFICQSMELSILNVCWCAFALTHLQMIKICLKYCTYFAQIAYIYWKAEVWLFNSTLDNSNGIILLLTVPKQKKFKSKMKISVLGQLWFFLAFCKSSTNVQQISWKTFFRACLSLSDPLQIGDFRYNNRPTLL